jgi:TPR repeat protein
MTNLDFMYERGRCDLPQDVVQAISWYRNAADLSDEDAKAAL